ncbi:hypothetical protein BG000_009217 [Podila horticola]|nr:hypothetical protein BG000_009217 [Podila horticola]
MKFQTILLVAAALMITYVRAAPIDIVEQPDVNPDDQKAKCGYDMLICCVTPDKISWSAHVLPFQMTST